jgi:hypothetical protein
MQSIHDIIDQCLDEFVDGIRRRHIAEGQKATGKSIASLEKQLFDNGGLNFTAQLFGLPHLGTFDKGAGPHRKRGTDEQRAEFIRSLTEWCRVRGFPSSGLTEEQYLRTANWLKWYIGKFGTRRHRDKALQDKVITPEIVAFEKRLNDRLMAYFDLQFDNKFFF